MSDGVTLPWGDVSPMVPIAEAVPSAFNSPVSRPPTLARSRFKRRNDHAGAGGTASVAGAGRAGSAGAWPPRDDAALILGIEQSNDIGAVCRSVKLSRLYSVAEVRERWHTLLYDEKESFRATSAMIASRVDGFALVSPGSVLWSVGEEDLLREVPESAVGPEEEEDDDDDDDDVFRQLLTLRVAVFHPSRTPRALRRHWQLLRRHGMLCDATATNEAVANSAAIEREVEGLLAEISKSTDDDSHASKEVGMAHVVKAEEEGEEVEEKAAAAEEEDEEDNKEEEVVEEEKGGEVGDEKEEGEKGKEKSKEDDDCVDVMPSLAMDDADNAVLMDGNQRSRAQDIEELIMRTAARNSPADHCDDNEEEGTAAVRAAVAAAGVDSLSFNTHSHLNRTHNNNTTANGSGDSLMLPSGTPSEPVTKLSARFLLSVEDGESFDAFEERLEVRGQHLQGDDVQLNAPVCLQRELHRADRLEKRRIRRLEQQLTWVYPPQHKRRGSGGGSSSGASVDGGIAAGEDDALAVFMSDELKVPPAYMRARQIVVGRSTAHLTVDIDLSRHFNSSSVSRQHALIRLNDDGALYLHNIGRRPVYIMGAPVPTGRTRRLPASCLLEIGRVKLLFNVNVPLLRQIHLEAFSAPDPTRR